MKITITPTDQILLVNGAPLRVWDGLTGGGKKCTVLVAFVRVPEDADSAEFDAELIPVPPPAVRTAPATRS